MGPKSEADLANCETPHTVLMLYAVITQQNLWLDVLNGSEGRGFMFSSPKALDKVYYHPAVQSAADLEGHSGFSFALCMRFIERMAHEHISHFSSEYSKSSLSL